MKLLIPTLFLSSALMLSSCSQMRQVREVTKMIADLPTIELPSEEAVLAAENAYGSLPEEAKATVKNYRLLQEARERLEQSKTDTTQSDSRLKFAGEWLELSDQLHLFQPIVYWFGPLSLLPDGDCRSESSSYSWEVSDDERTLLLKGARGKITLNVINDGGFTKLADDSMQYCFLRAAEIEDYINSRFVLVNVDADSVRDYISLPVCAGAILDEKDKPTGKYAWIQPSPVFDKGLVYYGRSEDFYYSLIRNGTESLILQYPYDTLSDGEIVHFAYGKEAGGTIVFIRSEYVAENETSLRTRTLSLTDGTFHTTLQNWYVDVIDYTDGHQY